MPSMRFAVLALLAAALWAGAPGASAEDELPPTSRFFEEFDRNADGRVTQEEFRGAAEVFRLLDKDGDGAVSPDELGLPADYKPAPKRGRAAPGGEAPAGKGGPPARDRPRGRMLERLMQMDADGDKRVSKDEWKGPPEAFARFDRNQDGFLDAKDMEGREGPGKGRPRKGGPGEGPGKGGPRKGGPRKGGPGNGPEDAPSAEQMKQRAQERFAAADRNGDGKLTADELPSPRLLDMADGDKDGAVTQAEFEAFLQRMARGRGGRGGRGGGGERGGRLSAGMLQRWDRDGDGKVSAEEFPGRPELFERLDADKDGFLGESDVKARQDAGQGAGPDAKPAARAGNLIEQQDTDGDGRLNRTEFKGSPEEWRLLDRNGDGWVTPDELKPAR